MGANSKIEWTDHTFNPWVGCTKISPACDHCYAEGWAKRTGQAALWQGERRRTSEANWRQPLKWDRDAAAAGVRRRVFCASLADVFDNQVPVEWRDDLWRLIAATPHLDWLLLTKRPQNIGKMVDGFPRNVWLGTTIENRREGQRRAWELAQVPAAVRFWSCEPLLEDLGDLTQLCLRDIAPDGRPAVSWVIAGGESGPHARPAHPDWFRSLRDQCAAAGVAFHFKQWGEWAPGCAFGLVQDGPITTRVGDVRDWMRRYVVCADRADRLDAHSFTAHATNLVYRVGKKRAGRLLDGGTYDAFPEAAR